MSVAQGDTREQDRSLQNEAKETSGVTSSLLLGYVEQAGGREAVEALLDRCGLRGCEAELRDENTWFSWETKIELFQAASEVLDTADFFRDMAVYALDANVAGGLKIALRKLGSPQFVFRNIVRANARFVRSHVLELLTLEKDHALLRFSEIGDGHRHHRLDCEYTAGLLAIIPGLFGLPAAHVTHAQCAAEGAEACIFELHWKEHPVSSRLALIGLAGSVAATGVSAAVAPVAFPFAGALTVVGGSVWLHHRVRWRREQWRHLQRQLDDTELVNQRLFESLQDLVGDLRLDEVVAKVTRHAQAAVGGRDFLLLVREGDGLICQSSSDLPFEAVAAVETWANDSPRVMQSSMLIDHLSSVEALRPLGSLPDPLCSLASAVLSANGEAFGLLVALGGQQETFLPRDVSVLESYAAQVAIALSNARLYQNQRSLAERDPLTGLLNHRRFHEAMDRELERCAREGFYSSLVLVDLDQFKQVNDEDGHAAGDRVLRAAARSLSDVCRRDDLAFRIGGDEFALLLPRLDELEAEKVADRVCTAIGEIDSRMGASAGVACAPPGMTDKAALIAEADRRLYRTKNGSTRYLRAPATSGVMPTRAALDILLGVLELHHGSTVEHSDIVARLALGVARRMGLEPAECELVEQTALIHDLGKIAIPCDVLDKPATLTEEEWGVVRGHPAAGADLLLRVPELAPLAGAVRASHERWDGGGYPDGLAGPEIPRPARIVTACDAFEAMTGRRPYRSPLSFASALDELRACAGTQFDPAVIKALVAEVQSGEQIAFLSAADSSPSASAARSAA